MDNVVVVSGLSETFTDRTIHQIFEHVGKVSTVENVAPDTALVTFKTHQDAARATQTKRKLEGKILLVCFYPQFLKAKFLSCAFTETAETTETTDYFEIKIGQRTVEKLLIDGTFTHTVSEQMKHSQGRFWLRLPEHVGITCLRRTHACKVLVAKEFERGFLSLKDCLKTGVSLPESKQQHVISQASSSLEIIIPCVSPVSFEFLKKSGVLREWHNNYNGLKAKFVKGRNLLKMKGLEETIHSARDDIIRHIEDITEEQFSVSRKIAKMYEGNDAKNWVQEKLDKSGHVCYWEPADDIITVVAHYTNHPVLKEFFKTVFKKGKILLTGNDDESDLLVSDTWTCLLLENIQQNREGKPVPVIQVSEGKKITIVDIPSEIDSTIAAVKDFLARNTTDTKEGTDLQTSHVSFSSFPSALSETVQSTCPEAILANNNRDAKNTQSNEKPFLVDRAFPSNQKEAEKKMNRQKESKDETNAEVRENKDIEKDSFSKACFAPHMEVLHPDNNQQEPEKEDALDSESKDEGETEKQDKKHKSCKDGKDSKALSYVSEFMAGEEQTTECLLEKSDGIPAAYKTISDSPSCDPFKRTDAETELAETKLTDLTESRTASNITTKAYSSPDVTSCAEHKSIDNQPRDYGQVCSEAVLSTADTNEAFSDDQYVLSITEEAEEGRGGDTEEGQTQPRTLDDDACVLLIRKEEGKKQQEKDEEEDKPDHLSPEESEQNNHCPIRKKQEKGNTHKLDSESHTDAFMQEDGVEINESNKKCELDISSTMRFNSSHGSEGSHHDSSCELDELEKTHMDSDTACSGMGHDKHSQSLNTKHLTAETDIATHTDSNEFHGHQTSTVFSSTSVSFSCPGLARFGPSCSVSDVILDKFQDVGDNTQTSGNHDVNWKTTESGKCGRQGASVLSSEENEAGTQHTEDADFAPNRNLLERVQPSDDGNLLPCELINASALSDGCSSETAPEAVAESQDTHGDIADTHSGNSETADLWKQLHCLDIDQLLVVASYVGISDRRVSDLRARYSVDEDFRHNLIDRCATTGSTNQLCAALFLLVQKGSGHRNQTQPPPAPAIKRPVAAAPSASFCNPALSSSTVQPSNHHISTGNNKQFDTDHNHPHAGSSPGSSRTTQHHFTTPYDPFTSAFHRPTAPKTSDYSFGVPHSIMHPHYSCDQSADASGNYLDSFTSDTVPNIHVQGHHPAADVGQSQHTRMQIRTETASPERTSFSYLQTQRQMHQAERSTEASAKSKMDAILFPGLMPEMEKEVDFQTAQATASLQQQLPCCHHKTDDQMNARFAQMEKLMRETLAHMELQMETRMRVQFSLQLQAALDAQEQVHLAQRRALETSLRAQTEAGFAHIRAQVNTLQTNIFELRLQPLVNRNYMLLVENDSETPSSTPSSDDVSSHA